MGPERPLPYAGAFASADDYVQALLRFARTTDVFQVLCGGVHILDFFTTEPGLFRAALPPEWHEFLLAQDAMGLLDLLMRDDLDAVRRAAPESLARYIAAVRDLSMRRDVRPRARDEAPLPALPRAVAVGMKPKKMHEVANFAAYICRLADDMGGDTPSPAVTHFVDLGSGQNYLGRALASAPYNRRVVAVEGREANVAGARVLDRLSGLAVKQKVMRNKKLWTRILAVRDGLVAGGAADGPQALADAVAQVAGAEAFDFRPIDELESRYGAGARGGCVQYVSGRLDSGHLGEVIASIDGAHEKQALMAVSIHSCGNLSHHGIRSLVLNPSIRAVAIVGCCYNLMTERLGPPTYKHRYLRPSLQAVNGRVVRESDRRDPQGFPMSDLFATTRAGDDDGDGDGDEGAAGRDGVRLNITARMMACQAPQNWTREESEGFFTRHFYRAVLQKIFLDRGVVQRIHHRKGRQQDGRQPDGQPDGQQQDGQPDGQQQDGLQPDGQKQDGLPDGLQGGGGSPFDCSTNPVTIGSLRKSCYSSLRSYVRGAVEKLTTSNEHKQYAGVMKVRMAGITDGEIDAYEAAYLPRRKELCVVWSLMAFSATVVEALIVADRWTFLREQGDVVREAWVEAVFEYGESPRNLVVVGIKGEACE